MIRYKREKNLTRLAPIGQEIFFPNGKVDFKTDTSVFVIHCPKHETIAVYEDANSGIKWLPFTPVRADQ